MKKLFWMIFLVLIQIGLTKGTTSKQIRIVSTANVHGETDPCGWKKKPLGGLARKATIIDNLRSEGFDVLILDAGNLLFKKETLGPGTPTETAKMTAEIIIAAFNNIACHAFSPGSKDFAAGLDFLMTQHNNANFPYVSCNIANKTNKLLFKPYVIKKSKGFKVGIIGLSSIFESDGVVVLDPFVSLDTFIEHFPFLKEQYKSSSQFSIVFVPHLVLTFGWE